MLIEWPKLNEIIIKTCRRAFTDREGHSNEVRDEYFKAGKRVSEHGGGSEQDKVKLGQSWQCLTGFC